MNQVRPHDAHTKHTCAMCSLPCPTSRAGTCHLQEYHKFTAAQVSSLLGGTMGQDALIPQLQGLLVIWQQELVALRPELHGLPRYTVYVDSLEMDEQAQLDAAAKDVLP